MYNLGHKFLLKSVTSSAYPTNGSVGGYLANNEALANRWRKPGDEVFTNIPGISGVNFNSIDRFLNSDENVRNAGTVRLQQVTLGYSVPKALLSKSGFIKAINIGATVSNLGLLWAANKEGIDPSYQMDGQFLSLPPTRNYVLNFRLSL